LIFLALAALAPVEQARAHRLIVNCQVLPGQKVKVVSLYSDPFRSFPARGAMVRVRTSDTGILAEGKTDAQGEFVFSFKNVEPIRVEVSQLDHEAEVTIPAASLSVDSAHAGPAAGSDTTSSAPRSPPGNPVASSADNPWREGIKDVLIGVTFLLALAAFMLSLRNARRLRELSREPSARALPPRSPEARG
jgi:hypothetical protein